MAVLLAEQAEDVVPDGTPSVEDTFVFLRRTICNMQKSMRRARPTPQASVEAGLDLMLAAVETHLDLDARAA